MLGLCDPVNILALCRAKHSSVLQQTLRMDCLNVFGQSISRWSQVLSLQPHLLCHCGPAEMTAGGRSNSKTGLLVIGINCLSVRSQPYSFWWQSPPGSTQETQDKGVLSAEVFPGTRNGYPAHCLPLSHSSGS